MVLECDPVEKGSGASLVHAGGDRDRFVLGNPRFHHEMTGIVEGSDPNVAASRITSGPAARTAAFRGRIHGCSSFVTASSLKRTPTAQLDARQRQAMGAGGLKCSQ
jgi:hypothetical protein